MTSQRKITANRSNSQSSSGPRTADGKRRASDNSREHGWAALQRHHHPSASPEVEELAKVLCGDEQNPVLLVHARIIAENELLRRAIGLQKLQAIEQRLAEMQRSHKSLEGDECQALETAAAELDRLERYESRAWSRQRRAIHSFIELSQNS